MCLLDGNKVETRVHHPLLEIYVKRARPCGYMSRLLRDMSCKKSLLASEEQIEMLGAIRTSPSLVSKQRDQVTYRVYCQHSNQPSDLIKQVS